MARDLRDVTGEKCNGWEFIRCVSYGHGKPSVWLARHHCGHEQELRICQVRRPSASTTLCGSCGNNRHRKVAVSVKDALSKTEPRDKGLKRRIALEACKNVYKSRKGQHCLSIDPASLVNESGATVSGKKILPMTPGSKLQRLLSRLEVGISMGTKRFNGAEVAMEQLDFAVRVMVSDHGVNLIRITLRCTSGVIADVSYQLGGISIRIASKTKKRDRTHQAPQLLKEMVEWIKEQQYTGVAQLTAACYGGEIYKLKRSLETTVVDEEE